MKMRFAIAFACGASAAYIQDADPPDALEMLLLANSRVPVRSAAPQSKLMNRRQTAAGLLSVIAAGIVSPAHAGVEQDALKFYEESGINVAAFRDYWELALPKQIEKGKWETIEEYMRPPDPSSKTKKGRRGGTAYRFRLSLNSYICSGEGPQSKVCAQGKEYAEDVRDACRTLLVAARGKVEEDGMLPFLKSSKELDKAGRQKLALQAYGKGAKALAAYIELSNTRINARRIAPFGSD